VWSHRIDFIVVTSPCLTTPRPEATQYRLVRDIMSMRYFWDNYRHVLSALWASPFNHGTLRSYSGRYYHLFVSRRIECDLPSPPILLTREIYHSRPIAADVVLPVELPPEYTEEGVVPAVPSEPLPGYLLPSLLESAQPTATLKE